jgi:hypothetical protein
VLCFLGIGMRKIDLIDDRNDCKLQK